jgi:hypothetical protein
MIAISHPISSMGDTAGAWVQQLEAQSAPRLYVLPYLQYGPNNQYLQLMEAAVVARALGRALVAPTFNAWVNDESASGGQTFAFEETFDAGAVARCIPLVAPADAMRAGIKGHPLVMMSDFSAKKTQRFLAAQRLPCCPRHQRLPKQRIASEEQLQRMLHFDRGVPAVLGWHSFFAVERKLLLATAKCFARASPIRAQAHALASW